MPKHKKYPPAGNKSQMRLNRVWLDQADALEVKENEEVTLMDWGNCIIRVRAGWGPLNQGISCIASGVSLTRQGYFGFGRP